MTDSEAGRLGSVDRDTLIADILQLECDFPVDLTEEFLQSQSLARLRHIYMALRMRVAEPITSRR
ncbi:hypothetical protein LCGC14_2212740 [marine sediment metagenome]|uniref:Carrier domain-containing protein n=1 Tax=marine sediment metagenome TaxID=412755 RepID=A0A0F9DD77_9ZZZZ